MMEQWRQSIILGNQNLRKRQLVMALVHFQRAKYRAEKLLEQWFEPQEAVAAVVISYHNLADLYESQGRPNLAEKELRRVYQLLSDRLSRQGDNQRISERKAALLYGQKQTHMALLSLLQRYREVDEAAISPFV